MLKRFWLTVLSILLFLGFVYFSYLVAKERFTNLDFNTTVRLQDHFPRRFDEALTSFSIIGSFEVTTIFWLVICIWLLLRRFWLTTLSMSLFVGASLIEVYGKLFVLHPEPPHFLYRGILPFQLPKYYIGTDYSYPSGHATRSSFLITFLLMYILFRFKSYLTKLACFVLLLTFLSLMLFSRVYLGEHWLSDVIGGTLLGASLGIIPALFLPSPRRHAEINSTIQIPKPV